MAVSAAAVLVLGCADGGGGGDEPPLVAQVAPAIAAVESTLGGPQDFFEVNATPQLVNLIVASDGATTATAFVYLDGELRPPAPPNAATGETFRADDLDLDADVIFTGIADELDDPTISQFVVVGGPGSAVQYSAFVTSSQGGVLDVLLGPDGTVLGVNPV